MAGYLQQDADNNWGNITFELRADAENDDLQYKLFKNNPSISVLLTAGSAPRPMPAAAATPKVSWR